MHFSTFFWEGFPRFRQVLKGFHGTRMVKNSSSKPYLQVSVLQMHTEVSGLIFPFQRVSFDTSLYKKLQIHSSCWPGPLYVPFPSFFFSLHLAPVLATCIMKPDPNRLSSELDPIFHPIQMDKVCCSGILITTTFIKPQQATLYRLCASFCGGDLILHWSFWCLCFQGW
jgi:hypothetical protein